MTALDWEEVKRLAADFQRAQLSSTSQTLSERNCIEIINKLIELNLLDVIFTTDGKEYITPQYLVKEIKDELYVNGGRINLVELSHTLNVDLSHVSAKAAEVERSTPGCVIIMGQLIDQNYTTHIAQEVNDRLKSHGKITVADLTRTYDLPSDFLQSVVEKNLGKLIDAKQDKSDNRVFYTSAFVEKNKAEMRGVLTAITRPTQVANILQACDIQERDFYFAFESLTEEKQISGVLTAKQGGNSIFIPYVYTKQQNEWVDNFYKQNHYLEYDGLIRLGISEPVMFVRRHFPNVRLIELTTCAVGPHLINLLENSVEETLLTGSYLDTMMMLPSVLTTEDIAKLVELVLKRCKNKSAGNVQILCETVLVTEKFIQELMKPFHEKGIIQQKAEEVVASGQYMQILVERKLNKGGGGRDDHHEDTKAERREERRRKAATGKGGGGTQGRETKTKSVKKKHFEKKGGGRGDHEDSEEEVTGGSKPGGRLELFTVDEVEAELGKQLAEETEDLVKELAEQVTPLLNRVAAEEAARVFERSAATGAEARRKHHSQLQEFVDMKLIEIRLCEKGLKHFPSNGELQTKLGAHLVKSVGGDVANALFGFIGREMCSRSVDWEATSIEARAKVLTEISPDQGREHLAKLHKVLTSQAPTVDEFMATVEQAFAVADLIVKKPDKKKEKAFLTNHREALTGQLLDDRMMSEADSSSSPGLVLHMAVLLLFQAVTQNVIHASGKFVPQLLQFLKPHLAKEQFDVLRIYQELVMKLLTVGEDEELAAKTKTELNEHASAVRNLVRSYKLHDKTL